MRKKKPNRCIKKRKQKIKLSHIAKLLNYSSYESGIDFDNREASYHNANND